MHMRETFFLDLRDKPSVVDFLVEHLEYADGKQRAAAEKWITAYHDGETVHTDTLADAARKFAIAVWSARYALNRFFVSEGSEIEWEKVRATIRPSTAHLLERVRRFSDAQSLDATLRHAESEVALKEGERVEIAEVRKHVRHDYWREHHKDLAKLVTEGEQRLKEYLGTLKVLRDIALDLPRSMQDEVFSKIAHYEDRILFEVELVPKEILQQEAKYYTEQKELSPLE